MAIVRFELRYIPKCFNSFHNIKNFPDWNIFPDSAQNQIGNSFPDNAQDIIGTLFPDNAQN